MSLPALPPSGVWWRPNVLSGGTPRNGGASGSASAESDPKVPVLPFNVLLLQKLQAWDDHRRAEELRYQEKAPVDVEDLKWMLGVAVPRYFKLDPRKSATIWRNRELFDEEFEKRSRERVVEFCEMYPAWTKVWKSLGFEVPFGTLREMAVAQ
ncbi:hypothetical protein C0995_007672 [Termitomyces sp. Mi166|nr:hypothetical protein C0995_007672 [Termitomyces sp. Mi166\